MTIRFALEHKGRSIHILSEQTSWKFADRASERYMETLSLPARKRMVHKIATEHRKLQTRKAKDRRFDTALGEGRR